jgi:hypothetical protein
MRLSFFFVMTTCAAVLAGACGSSTVAPTPLPAVSAPAVTVISLSIDGNASLSMKGETSQLTAHATMSNGQVEDKTSSVTWSSSVLAVATVTDAGLLTAMGDGRTLVTATFQTIAATKPVVVDLPVH